MKKAVAFVILVISLASCHGKFNVTETRPLKYTCPEAYYSAPTNDFSRIIHALKLNPADSYASYSAFITQ
jgi:hypothetical protein